NPESRDSRSGPSDHPGMTGGDCARAAARPPRLASYLDAGYSGACWDAAKTKPGTKKSKK
ncbi:MAG TPA: hypothetical protein VIK28_05335, partial [Sedimentisphaerales bacterium]